ncbi:uncharacterized protein LOC117171937 [Belonocnema kinseyi]|uniref:uncharacterized protein LOC117171937 n=1 Tax=Belonocnema kinseyi TaxID=2817044 RepID=UPI00143CCD27|nr:uncharacterized protein LOC117171937 [Belonocnema kinseyi]
MKNSFYGFSRWWIFMLILFEISQNGEALDCFKCVSIGGDNKACDDPFHNNGSLEFLESPCLGGRKNRDGLFPATACVKIAGIYDESGESLTIRSCALDSGTLTTDSELIRMSHCGGFYFDNKYVRGCVQSCNDADACNLADINSAPTNLLFICCFIMKYFSILN